MNQNLDVDAVIAELVDACGTSQKLDRLPRSSSSREYVEHYGRRLGKWKRYHNEANDILSHSQDHKLSDDQKTKLSKYRLMCSDRIEGARRILREKDHNMSISQGLLNEFKTHETLKEKLNILVVTAEELLAAKKAAQSEFNMNKAQLADAEASHGADLLVGGYKEALAKLRERITEIDEVLDLITGLEEYIRLQSTKKGKIN